ncbi:MAG: chromate transporter [Oscillibacter sp.]|jgi:chromate transporter|nr:chromate transporter [Oscillibacter sp.]
MIYLQLFWEYFKVGLFSVGGGMATIPFLYDLSTKTGWFTHAQLADMLAVSESTPGAIGVNMATYVGYTTAGFWGALIATIGLVTPSIIVILLVAKVLEQFRHNRFVEAGFYGLRPASTGLIAAAGVTVFMIALMNTDLYEKTKDIADLFRWKGCLLAVAVLVFSNWVKPTKKWHPIIFIGISAVIGVVFHFAGV